MDDTTAERLRRVGATVAAAEQRLTEARKERDAAIREAVAARYRISAIARTVGVSRNAVYDIAGPPPAEDTP